MDKRFYEKRYGIRTSNPSQGNVIMNKMKSTHGGNINNRTYNTRSQKILEMALLLNKPKSSVMGTATAYAEGLSSKSNHEECQKLKATNNLMLEFDGTKPGLLNRPEHSHNFPLNSVDLLSVNNNDIALNGNPLRPSTSASNETILPSGTTERMSTSVSLNKVYSNLDVSNITDARSIESNNFSPNFLDGDIESDYSEDDISEYFPSSESESDTSIVIELTANTKQINRTIDDNDESSVPLPILAGSWTGFDTINSEIFSAPVSSSSARIQDIGEIASTECTFQSTQRLPIVVYQGRAGDAESISDNFSVQEISVQNLPLSPRKLDESKQIRSVAASGYKDKPKRPCPFCEKEYRQLQRHISAVHKNLEEVKEACKGNSKERNKNFGILRKKGIHKHNMELLKTSCSSPKFLRERKRSNDDSSSVAVCNNCQGYFQRRCFHAHKKRCTTTGFTPVSMIVDVRLDISEDFRTNILHKFKNDKVGKLCQSNKDIIEVGCFLYQKLKRKQDKIVQVRRGVRLDMRKLGHLYVAFCDILAQENIVGDISRIEVRDLLNREYFDALKKAIINCTQSVENSEAKSGLKPGLRISYFYLLKRFAKMVKVKLLIQRADAKASDIEVFLDILSMHDEEVFGEARYQIHRNRLVNLRRPMNLPDDSDVNNLRDYIKSRVDSLVSDAYVQWNGFLYSELRDLIVTRLTLFNARRGGEPARLSLAEWEDAKVDGWIDSRKTKDLDDVERRLFKEFKITYQSGKGDHLVPILFPADTFKSMFVLADLSIRQISSVSSSNIYAFPNIKASTDHVSGWHAVHRVAVAAGVSDPSKITATKFRHRVSTIFAALDVPEQDRALMFSHLGHSENMNVNLYQAPLVHQEITVVGRHLHTVDQSAGCNKRLEESQIHHAQSSEGPDSDLEEETEESLNHVTESISEANSRTGNSVKSTQRTLQEAKYRCSWSAEDTNTVAVYFKKYLKSGGLPGKKEVYQFMSSYPEIWSSLPATDRWKKIKNKVMNIQNVKKQQEKKWKD